MKEFLRTTTVFTEQQQQVEATNEQLEAKIEAANARVVAAETATAAYARRISELEADVADLEEELAATSSGAPQQTKLELAVDDDKDSQAEPAEDINSNSSSFEYSDPDVANMGLRERLEKLEGWPSKRARELLLEHCLADVVGLENACIETLPVTVFNE